MQEVKFSLLKFTRVEKPFKRGTYDLRIREINSVSKLLGFKEENFLLTSGATVSKKLLTYYHPNK